MTQRSFGLGLLFITMFVWSGCDSGQDVQDPATTETAPPPPVTEAPPAPTGEPTMPPNETTGMADTPPAKESALMVPAETAGAEHNNEGLDHYQQGHWDVAQEHFQKAVEANPELPEAHYNLALALDKMENHGEATEHFKKALELAPANPLIAESEILQAHVGG